TLDDYMNFARMLVNGGELNHKRVLKQETVKLMATNHLADSVTERMWLPGKGQVGFGIDFAVRLHPPLNAKENNGVVGEFFLGRSCQHSFLGGSCERTYRSPLCTEIPI